MLRLLGESYMATRPKKPLSWNLANARASKPISHQSWSSLSLKKKERRVHCLQILRLMRTTKLSLTFISKRLEVDVRTVKLHLKGYIFKKNNRWYPKAIDHIERERIIYERGKIGSILVDDSRVASTIGEYLNDVKKVLTDGDVSHLKKYKKIRISDAFGKIHKLETRIEQIKEIEYSRENVEMGDDTYVY
jgi:hypothetical protein